MTRNAARTAAAGTLLAVLVATGAACSGSEAGSGATATTVEASTATTSSPLGDLRDLDGAARGLSDGDLDCYDVQLAFVALTALPLAVSTGAGQEAVDQVQADLRLLRSQVPAAVADEFDTYAAGVQAYAEALKGIDLTTISDPATRQRVVEASQALESPTMTDAASNIERYFAATCPTPPPTSAAS